MSILLVFIRCPPLGHHPFTLGEGRGQQAFLDSPSIKYCSQSSVNDCLPAQHNLHSYVRCLYYRLFEIVLPSGKRRFLPLLLPDYFSIFCCLSNYSARDDFQPRGFFTCMIWMYRGLIGVYRYIFSGIILLCGCIIVEEVITSFYDDKTPIHKKMKKQLLR